jgi:hypothetical protein
MHHFPPRPIVCLSEETVETLYRPGRHEISAVRNDRIVEIKTPLILQPGPATLTGGLDAIFAVVAGKRLKVFLRLLRLPASAVKMQTLDTRHSTDHDRITPHQAFLHAVVWRLGAIRACIPCHGRSGRAGAGH